MAEKGIKTIIRENFIAALTSFIYEERLEVSFDENRAFIWL